jgi:hypothetical protein
MEFVSDKSVLRTSRNLPHIGMAEPSGMEFVSDKSVLRTSRNLPHIGMAEPVGKVVVLFSDSVLKKLARKPIETVHHSGK